MPVTRLRRSMTRLLGFGHLAFFLAWVLPLHGVPLAGRLSVAHLIAANVPLWAVGFGATAVLLLWAARSTSREKLSWWGHGLGVVVTMSYAGASGASAALSSPWGSFLPAGAFLTLSAWHLTLQRYYKKAGG